MKVGLGVRLDVLEHLAHVVARGKIAARTTQNDEADGFGLARNGVGVLFQRLEHILVERVQLLRAIQRERRCAAAILPAD